MDAETTHRHQEGGRGPAGGASVGGHLDLVGRLGLRRGHGRRRRSHHLVPKRPHPRGPRSGGFPLLQYSRRALRSKSSAGGAVESRHPCRLPPDGRLYRLNGGAGPATERPGRPESAGGRGHLGTAATARRQRTACLHAVDSRPLRAARQ